MKTRLYPIAITLLVLGITAFFSCQKDDVFTSNNSSNNNNSPILRSGVTQDYCVSSLPSEDIPVYETSDFVITTQTGKNTKTTTIHFGVTVTAHNDKDSTYITIARDNGEMTVRLAIPGIDATPTNGTTLFSGLSEGSFSIPNPENWKCGDPVTFSLYVSGLGGGQNNNFQSGIITYNLRDVCGCDESFEWTYNDKDNTYTFTYVPSENMTNANVVFTFAQGVNVEGLDDWTISGVTRQSKIDFTQCKEKSWTISLDAKCSGNSGSSNLWTDFKVNGISKKGSNPNIVQACN